MELLALGITVLAHIVGAGVLIWAMLDGAESSWRDIWPRDDDGGGGEPPTEPPVVMPPPSFPDEYPARAPGRERTPV